MMKMTVVFEITTQEQIKMVMDALIKATPDTKIKIEEQETRKPAKDPEKKPAKEPKEVKFVPIDKVAPKKKRTKEAQEAIDAIKEAYAKKRDEKRPEKKTRVKRSDIDDAKIVKMRDEDGMKFNKIAKEIGCCEQTVINRYNKAKNGGNR
jgi:DNA-binding transcriptional regulator YiaG